MYSILFHGLKCKTPGLNKKYYGVKTYTSLPLRKLGEKVQFPVLSIFGLDKNPSFEKFIPFSSLKGNDDDGIVLTKESEFISTWEIKGLAFEVENEERQDSINKLLGNVFIAFSNEPVAFYFNSVRHDVDTHLKANYKNKYLKEINDLYYKSFIEGSSKSTNLYLTMVYNPFLNTTEKKKFQNLSKNKYDNELLNFIQKFRDYSNRLEANLSKFRAKKLQIYSENGKSFSNQLEFYNYLIGGVK
jgi:type IV secretion system protein VirB4